MIQLKKTPILFLFAFLFSSNTYQSQTYVKGNVIALAGFLNVAIERKVAPRYTIQGDLFVSPWKSYAGKHLQVIGSQLEGRYYFDEAFNKWYVGANVGLAVFDIEKWGYWKLGVYQHGFTALFGGTLGYQMKIKKKWNLDFYISAGNSQANYRSYWKSTGIRYDSAKGNNRSGEWIPYRGGIMVSYKL